MWPDRVSNPGPLALESDALPTEIRSPARLLSKLHESLKLQNFSSPVLFTSISTYPSRLPTAFLVYSDNRR